MADSLHLFVPQPQTGEYVIQGEYSLQGETDGKSVFQYQSIGLQKTQHVKYLLLSTSYPMGRQRHEPLKNQHLKLSSALLVYPWVESRAGGSPALSLQA